MSSVRAAHNGNRAAVWANVAHDGSGVSDRHVTMRGSGSALKYALKHTQIALRIPHGSQQMAR